MANAIKYEDKSAGQPEMAALFLALKEILAPYNGRGTLQEKGSGDGQYHLYSFKKVEISGRKLDELYFASILVQKGYVGFYFFPIYCCPEIKPSLKPELLKCLKGKNCFHIKKNNDVILNQIKYALQLGFDTYKKNGWV